MIDTKKVFDKVFRTYEYYCKNDEMKVYESKRNGTLVNKTFYCHKIKSYFPDEQCEKKDCLYIARRKMR